MADQEERSGFLDGTLSRRQLLKRGAIGAAGLTVIPAVVAACSGASTPSPTSQPSTQPSTGASQTPQSQAPQGLSGNLTLGSNHSDASEKKGMDAIDAAFKTANPNVNLKLNTVDHNTFQDQINNYLNGTPDDAYTWFSGYRMRFFASKGLATPIDDIWANLKSNYTAGFANSVVGDDGKVYGVPVDYYPWCVFYRKSVFSSKGYTVPQTWNDFLALCDKMKKDGLTPIAFGDKDGWPAMGTFDIIDLRLNGYQFHVDLMSGKNKWTDPKVATVFQTWAKLIPYYTAGFPGLTWQQACDTLIRSQAGMFFLGLFMTGEVTTVDKSVLSDIDFFPFPFFGNQWDSEQALDAPIDIWMISSKAPSLQQDLANAKAYLSFFGKGSTQVLMFQNQPGFIPTASDADTSSYDVLTKKAVEIVSKAQKITQFLDRDTRPDFAGANAMQSFLLNFLKNPTQDLGKLAQTIQDFWDKLPQYNG